MSDPMREYVASMVEESMGLAPDSVTEANLPQPLVDEVVRSFSGEPTGDVGEPFLERRFQDVFRSVQESQVREKGYSVRKMRWPRGLRLAVCLTHDVDNVSRPRGHVLRTRGRFGAPRLLRGAIDPSSLYNNIGLIAREEEARGFRSSFYLLTSNYRLGPLRAIASDLKGRGWDIGLHGDFGTHDSLEGMKAALQRFSSALGFAPSGVREHYLRFDPKLTWSIMDSLGLDYDTTVGLNDRLGFRLGLASPFHPPNKDGRGMSLLELPLTLMDTTLWGYLREGEEEGLEDVRRMLSQVEQVEGLFTLLWHQEAVKMRGGRIYWKILDELKARGCYVANAHEISCWWRARSAATIMDDNNNSIWVDGPSPAGLGLMIKTSGRVTAGRGCSVTPTEGGYVAYADGEAGRDGFLLRVE